MNKLAEVHVFEDHIIKVPTEKVFSESNIENDITAFEDYKLRGIIVECEFSDSVWFIRNKRYNLTVSFGFELQPTINNSIKCYTLYLLNNAQSPKTVIQKINIINDSIFKSNNFSEDKIEDFFDYILLEIPKSMKYHYLTTNKEYFDFSPPSHRKEYIERLENNFRPYQSQTKRLPPFQDILAFNERLNNFFFNEEIDKTTKERFMPILIWWELTMKIPMRPEEFASIKRSNFSIVEGRYKLIIERTKPKNTYNISPQTEFYLIPELGRLIQSYIELCDSYYTEEIPVQQKEYLFPMHMRTRYLSEIGQRSTKHNLNEHNYNLGTPIFRNLLRDFYKEVIGSDLVELTTIDTRHLAICNMRIQGFNPLTISRLAGHASLLTQNHYANHLETFLDSKMKLLSEQIRNNEIRSTHFYTKEEVEYLPVVQKIKENSILSNVDRKFLREIEGGNCQDTEFPRNCITNCFLCPSFLLKMEDKQSIHEIITKTVKSLNKEYQTQLDSYEIAFQKSIDFFRNNKEIESNPIELNERLNNLTRSINNTVENLARINVLKEQVEEATSDSN